MARIRREHISGDRSETAVVDHPFVALVRRDLTFKRREFAEAVREGRMDPKVARARYDEQAALLEFLGQVTIRYDGERAYEAGHIVPATTIAMAESDIHARKLWEGWRHGAPKQEAE